MKNLIPFFFLSLFLLLSCKREEGVTALLLRAESRMESHSDSALSILRQLAAPEKLQGSQQADYALLVTQAMHKNDLPLTSDSLISVALHFYQNSDNALRKGQSYYYSGAVCEERGDPDTAFSCYLQAKEALQGSENFKLLGLVNASIGRIYYEKKLYQETVNYRKLAVSFFLRVSDSLSVSISARSVGHSYLLLNQLDSADFYLEKAFRFATTDGRRIEIQSDRQIVCRERGEYQENADAFLQVINLPGRSAEERACAYLTLGDFYLKQGKKAKAQNCFLKSLKIGSVKTQAACSHSLYHLKKEEGNYADALAYHEHFLLLFDSITRIQSGKEIVAMQLKYDKEKVLRDLYQKRMQLWLSLSVVSILLLLLFLLWRCYLTYQKRKEAELARNKVLLTKTQTEILDYKGRLVATAEQLDARQQDKETLLVEKYHIEEILHQKTEAVTGLMAEKKQMTSALNQFKLLLSRTNKPVPEEDCCLIEASHLYELLIACPQKSSCHTSGDWKLLFFWTDIACRKFYSRLKEAYPLLKKRDLQICCLMKLGFSNKDMQTIFEVQQGTLYTDKNNAKRRLSIKEGVKLEDWLSSF